MIKLNKILQELDGEDDSFERAPITKSTDILGVLTEEDHDNLDPQLQGLWMGYQYRMTYEIVTPESAEQGDAEERGWEIEEPEHANSLEELMQAPEYDHSWIEWSSSHLTGDEWITSQADEDRDYFEKGEEKTYGLFIKRSDGKDLSEKEMGYIHEQLGLHGTFTYIGKYKDKSKRG